MTDISAIGSNGALGVERATDAGGDVPPHLGSSRRSPEPDRVEVSRFSELRARLAGLPPIRQALVDRIRGEIDAGRYDTDARMDDAIDALLREEQDFDFLDE